MENRNYNAKAIISGFRKGAGFEKAEEVADILGVSKPTYLKYERKPWTMSLATLDRLEELFGEEFVDFFWKHKLYKQQ